ncbi:MAG TPA: ATP-binding protein, partial [Candidatus Polarisedimenticolaceae bacterium]|nr:ATP-binding protein [Candidatus Polarisedimenticolaceae bacterium]
RAGLVAALATLRRAWLGVGLAAVIIAAALGAWIASATLRPVTELVRSVDAIAAGKADVTAMPAASDEFGELIAAFSRLHEALAAQQQSLLAAERVAAWREVARHVAHEVKNPLAPIRLTVENLRRARLQAPERFEALFDEGTATILEEVEQLRRMVAEFSEFARLPPPARQPVRIDRLIDAVLDLHAAEDGVVFSRRYDPQMPAAPLDPDQLSQALKNVVGNAVDAVRGAGRPGRIEVVAALERSTLRVEVADNGPGLSVEAARRIFTPYYTTKPGGTGLGMAITHRIVTEHGGTISAANRSEGGVRVTLRLPLEASR